MYIYSDSLAYIINYYMLQAFYKNNIQLVDSR